MVSGLSPTLEVALARYSQEAPSQSHNVKETNETKETEIELEEIMENLEQVSKFAQEESPKTTSRHMKFADGTKLKVSHGAAKAIHMVHGALNDENKQKFAEMLKNPKEFEKAANFALSKVDFTINKK